MFSFLPKILLQLLLSPTIHALVLPQPISFPPQSKSDNLTFTTGLGVCSSHTAPASKLPTFSDCEKAIQRSLPYYPGRAVFHNTGPDDAFKLPVFEEWGSCVVTVAIGGAGVSEERSSWKEIRQAATELNEVCQVDNVTGGKVQTGATNRIWIKLSRTSFNGALLEGLRGSRGVNITTS